LLRELDLGDHYRTRQDGTCAVYQSNLVQLGITLGLGGLWKEWFGGASFLNLSEHGVPVLEGFIGW
jgi:hypothetical protein